MPIRIITPPKQKRTGNEIDGFSMVIVIHRLSVKSNIQKNEANRVFRVINPFEEYKTPEASASTPNTTVRILKP
jgi:hypothetical protein